MLISLQVSNLALIEAAEVEFGQGLNVFSGETGAGKSLVIGSVNLALGGRAHGGIQRNPDKPAIIELVFSLSREEDREKLRELDLPIEEDGLVIIRRQIREGRSTTKLNGSTITGSQLKAAAGILLDIHGQHEHQSLLYAKNHLLILDRYSGTETERLLSDYKDKYHLYKKLEKELSESEKDESERIREMDLLSYEVKEIEDANIREGEDEELEERFRFMNHARKIAEAANEAGAFMGGDESAGELTARAVRAMGAVAEYDKKADDLYQELIQIDTLISDFRRDMESYLSDLTFSEQEFREITDRLDRLNGLKLKYGNTLTQVLAAVEERKERLSVLENFDAYRSQLKEKAEKARKDLDLAAERLSERRRECALELGKRLKEALVGLNFQTVEFEIQVSTTPGTYLENGVDTVDFLISTNPGEPMRPLSDVASGGELSRIMLALKTVLADTDGIETLIFDEIDTGISGRTAQRVSESLLKLSGRHQVILITHLPQIAAMADHHFLIEKGVHDGRTETRIGELDRPEMIRELSRLLSGAEVTERVLENAEEMKGLAERMKAEILVLNSQ
ncbi:MAG: DNA repair protein RecN [Lachnospiraceae bacterium]|nr:DNA repair protein RecN [Lachnospiraceae bacterium]